MMEKETFTMKMRRATREIHAISDALVNAKLAFGKFSIFLRTLSKGPEGCETLRLPHFLDN
jgi:hypothetical protein